METVHHQELDAFQNNPRAYSTLSLDIDAALIQSLSFDREAVKISSLLTKRFGIEMADDSSTTFRVKRAIVLTEWHCMWLERL
jgi:hypothetical protein